MFSFFSRNKSSATTVPKTENDAEVVSTTDNLVEAGSSNIGSIAPQFQFPAKQLHTPSPSIDGVPPLASAGPSATKPKAKPRAKPKPKAKPKDKEISPAVSEIPPGPVDTPSPAPEETVVTDPTALHALIASVPAQTLHSYTLARLRPSSASTELSPPTLTALTAFFSSLTPPPKLHCVRCHRGYFELENSDTACRVAHDDDSAIVERVGVAKSSGGNKYETLWNCCARTVEGDGNMGPPDGWCYEGAHTTDPKRARFRADATVQDDKLVSCARLRCGLPPLPPRSSLGRGSRKRARKSMEEEDSNEDDDEDVQSLSSTHTRSHARGASMSSVKGKAKDLQGDDAKVENTRPVKRARSRKQSTTMLPPAAKEKGDENAMDVDAPHPPSPPKSPGRKATEFSKAKPSSSGSNPIQKSPLSVSFIPAAARSESPTRKPRSQVEVQITRNTPKSVKIASGNLKGVKPKSSKSSIKGRTLAEVVDTSVDAERNWN